MTAWSSTSVLRIILAPMLALLLVSGALNGHLSKRAASLSTEIAGLRDSLASGGFPTDAEAIRERSDNLRNETGSLLETRRDASGLSRHPLFAANAHAPFQLLEYERERASLAQTLTTRAASESVRISEGTFATPDAPEQQASSRLRWGGLALLNELVSRAIDAKVAEIDVPSPPAIRPIAAGGAEGPVAEEIQAAVRVVGPTRSVQSFIETLALPAGRSSPSLHLSRILLRKASADASDNAEALLLVSALLTLEPEDPEP